METENPFVLPERIFFGSSDGQLFSVNSKYLSCSPLLEKLVTLSGKFKNDRTEEGAYRLQGKAADIACIFDYMNTGVYTKHDLETFDFFGIKTPPFKDYPEEFVKIWMEEYWQRKYTINNPVCKKFDVSAIISSIPKRVPVDGSRAVLTTRRLFNISTIFEAGKKIKFNIMNIDIGKYGGKLVLAGGSLVSLILSQRVNDYDFFFVGCTQTEAFDIVKDFMMSLGNYNSSFAVAVFACKNCWTINFYGKHFQFIFRNYKNVDEIMLGFDVDCCCVVYDGSNCQMSSRALYAFQNHVNTIDFERLSPTYEFRMAKYSKRGFDVFIPGIDVCKINTTIFDDVIRAGAKFYLSKNNGVLDVVTRYKRVAKSRSSMFTCSTKRRKIKRRKSGTFLFMQSGTSEKSEKNVVPEHVQTPGERTTFKTCFEPKVGYVQLKGMDVLLYLSEVDVQTINKVKVSDYLEAEKQLFSIFTVSDFKEHISSFKCVQNKSLKFVFSPERQVVQNVISEKLFSLMELKGVAPVWINENPGSQITSSYHSYVLNDISVWYTGQFYDEKTGEEPLEVEETKTVDI